MDILKLLMCVHGASTANVKAIKVIRLYLQLKSLFNAVILYIDQIKYVVSTKLAAIR